MQISSIGPCEVKSALDGQLLGSGSTSTQSWVDVSAWPAGDHVVEMMTGGIVIFTLKLR